MILSTGRLLLRLFGAVTAMLAILFVIAGWLLWSGPVSLAFLTPVFRDALNISVEGVRFDLDDTILTWTDWERAIDVRVRGVRIFDDHDRIVAGVPEMSLGVSGLALMEGRVALTRVELIRPEITLERNSDGSIGFGDQSGSGGDAGVVAATLLERLGAVPRKGSPAEYLNRASIRDARFTIVDHLLNRTWRASEANVSVARGAGRVVGEASARFNMDGASVPVRVRATHIRNSGQLALEVNVTKLEPNRVYEIHPSLSMLSALRAPVSGVIELTLDQDGVVGAVEFDLGTEPGGIRLPQYFDEDLGFEQVAVKGQIRDDLSVVQIDELFFDSGRTTATLNGLVQLEEDLVATLEGSLSNLPVDDLERYWPNELSRKARDWITTRVRGGTITRADVRLTVSPEQRTEHGLREDALEFTFDFEGVSARYLTRMPKLVDARGSAKMSGSAIDLDIESARIGDIALSEGEVRIEGLNVRQKVARIGFVGSGQMSDVLSVLDREPYRFARSIGLIPSSTSGLSAARIRFDFPLKEDLKGEEVRYAAAANIRDLGIPNIMGDRELSRGNLLVQIDANGVDAAGTAAIDGASVELEWHRAFRPKGPATSRLSVSANLDDEGRRALGLPAEPRVHGMTPVSAQILTKGWDILEISAAADLTNARLDFPELIWSKEPGSASGARFEMAFPGEEGDLVTSFVLSAPGLSATGQAELDANNVMRRLDLSFLEVGESSVSASVRPRAPEGYIVAIEGGRFDMRPYLSRLFGDDEAPQVLPLVLSMRVGEIVLSDRHSLSNAVGRAVYSGSTWQEMEAAGTLSGGVPIEISLLSKEGERKISVDSSDAGAFVRSLGVFDNGIGGQLRLDATIHEAEPGRPVDGVVSVSDFKVMNAPVFARILTIGSLSGMAGLLNGEGISFVRFNAPFSVKDGKLEVHQARAFGPALGITLEGSLDRDRGEVEMKGTLVPAYTLNSVLGNIPLLGNLFVGKQGEGVFAITYAVNGPLSEPTVSVNPLSALAPGFLRAIVLGEAEPGEEIAPENLHQGE